MEKGVGSVSGAIMAVRRTFRPPQHAFYGQVCGASALGVLQKAFGLKPIF